jgi:polysaccharide pyruvyl transferase WcaK-like protein
LPTSSDRAVPFRPKAIGAARSDRPLDPGPVSEVQRSVATGGAGGIFVDTSDYSHQNMGDVAMLQVSVRRLATLCPAASLHVLTEDVARLTRHCPEARPASCEGRRLWLAEREPFARAWAALPRPVAGMARGLKARLRWRRPAVLASAFRWSRRRNGLDTAELDEFLQAFYGARAMVVTGAGGITDHALAWATRVLDLLEIGARRGLPTAMFSHGLGPLTNPVLIERARSVLPRLSLIALREGRFGPALAARLGVDPERIVVTGDDAIELALEATQSPGDALGVNLRLSPSSGLGGEAVEAIRLALAAFVRFRHARILPVPIAFNERLEVSAGVPVYSDDRSIRLLLEGVTELPEGGDRLDSPQAVIRQIGQTRVVATAAYHAAVFALAQGIPAVCMAGSAYFEQKFLGLAHQFGPGCWVVRVDADGFTAAFPSALAEAWDRADELREPLRASALHQVEAGREAYQRFARLAALEAVA